MIDSQDNDTKRTGRQELLNPLLNSPERYVETGRDDTTFVHSSEQLNDYFASTVIVNFFEFSNVAWKKEKEAM
jgi:hypothetical protein